MAQNQAQLKNAQVDLARYKGLYAEDSIAKQTLDTAEAQVGQFLGLVKTNQAQVNDARLNLDFTQIRAPISGRVGLRQLDLGNLVAANDTTALVVITQTEPISVAFTLPETQLDTVLARYRSGASLTVEAWDRGDQKLQASGVLGSLDNQIDTTTGTLKFKGTFQNRDHALFPNQFVNVRLLADTLKQVVLAPAAAIQFGTDGTFAYVVDKDSKVNIRKLKVGPSDGDNSVIVEGLAAGERLVLEGTDRLREGTKVEVVDDSSQVPTTPASTCRARMPRARPRSVSRAPRRAHEPFAPVHPAAGRHHAEHAGHRPGRPDRLQDAARGGLAPGRLPDHPGHDPVPWRQSAGDDQRGDRAVGAPVRADAGS